VAWKAHAQRSAVIKTDCECGQQRRGLEDVVLPQNGLPDKKADSSVTEDSAVRRLVPSAQFFTFTLWHPDRVVDKSRNKYHRSLTESVSLATEIHRVDSD